IYAFYQSLLECLKHPLVRNGYWRLLECTAAWDGNATADQFVAFAWEGPQEERLVAAVNYGPAQGQCYVQIPWPDLRGRPFHLRDIVGSAVYDREGDDLA